MDTLSKPKRIKKDYTGVAERYRQGARVVDLAKEYGISRPGMYLRLKAEGITDFRDDRKKIDIAAVIDLYTMGTTLTNIAKQYNCTVSAISMMLKKHNVTTRHKAIMPDLETIDIPAVLETPKNTREAFKEFQKEFGKQLSEQMEESIEFIDVLNDDDDDISDIKALLNL